MGEEGVVGGFRAALDGSMRFGVAGGKSRRWSVAYREWAVGVLGERSLHDFLVGSGLGLEFFYDCGVGFRYVGMLAPVRVDIE